MKNILKINDFIKVYDVQVPDRLLLNIKNVEGYLEPAMTRSGDTEYRKCNTFWINDFFINNINNNETFKVILEDLNLIASSALDLYENDFPDIKKSLCREHSGFHILRYQKDGKYDRHIDDFKKDAFRRLSCSILLNDDYVGGEFEFFDCYKVNIKKNQVIVFPSTWQFPHKILPVTEGVRYSVVSWFI